MNQGLLSVLPNSINIFLITYFSFKMIDFATGILKTFKNGETPYKSAKMRDGLIRWIAELLGITFVILLDIILGADFALCMITLCLFIYKEAGSILENLYICGVPSRPPDRVQSSRIYRDNESSIIRRLRDYQARRIF